jgi:hypothetical protein
MSMSGGRYLTRTVVNRRAGRGTNVETLSHRQTANVAILGLMIGVSPVHIKKQALAQTAYSQCFNVAGRPELFKRETGMPHPS